MADAVALVETRRARQRRELVNELCAEARRQLQSGGRAAVSWRALARAVGLSPASLYTYFDSLDGLFTELILRSYGALAAATEAAADAFAAAPIGDRVLVGPLAYRHWALRHRSEFNLVFTDQLPGFAAEPGGVTVDAQRAVFRPIARPLVEHAGIDVADVRSAADLTPFLGLWGTFHGLVSLEVNHHLDWLDAPALFEERMRWAIAAAGLPPASAALVGAFERWASVPSQRGDRSGHRRASLR